MIAMNIIRVDSVFFARGIVGGGGGGGGGGEQNFPLKM